MSETLPGNIQCLLCRQPYTPVTEPREGQNAYPIYCSSCSNCLALRSNDPVRITFRDVLGLKDAELSSAVQEALIACPCGGRFSHDAGKRCPACIQKIDRERVKTAPHPLPTIWNVEKMRKWGDKILACIMEKLETREETLTQLIERFESGQIDAEEYMEGVERIPRRDNMQVCAVQTWAMILGPDVAFRAAEDLDLVDRYGTRVLVSIASALEMSSGRSVLSTLTKEVDNWEGQVKKELKMFLNKTAGG
ncbi:MAG: hypothetical protein HY580_01665 [Nitrospinae bacterium]|nr:hypothetical protein [Nitrospinota bacterium]